MNTTEKEEQLKQLLVDHHDMIYRLCYAYIYNKEDIEDLFQEITINIWKSLDQFRGDSRMSTWIYRVAVNTALLYNKKDKKRRSVIINQETQSSNILIDDADEYLEKEQNIQQLRKAMNHLDKQDRLIISLVLEGIKYDEIAEIMGMTSNYVGVKINRIKTRLFKLLKEANNG